MGFLELFILHCGLPEGVHIALLVSRKCIMVYILHSNNIVTGYNTIYVHRSGMNGFQLHVKSAYIGIQKSKM